MGTAHGALVECTRVVAEARPACLRRQAGSIAVAQAQYPQLMAT
jgi:hypothetical protein